MTRILSSPALPAFSLSIGRKICGLGGLLTCLMGLSGALQAQNWSGGAGADRSWGTAANWSTGVLPINTATVIFNNVDSGNAQPSVISSNLTLAGIRIQPVATSQTVSHTISIAASSTLSLTGTTALDLGATTTDQNGSTVNAIFQGGGTLSINNASGVMDIGTTAGTATAVENTFNLDLRGLAAFNAAISALNIGSGHRAKSTVYLSNTANNLNATTINVGNTGGSSNPGTSARLYLGSGTNVIQATTLTIGAGKQTDALMGFGTASGTLNLSAKDPLVGLTINVGYSTVTTGGGVGGTLDLSGHNVTVAATKMTIGERTVGSIANTSVGVNGVVSFSAGTFSVTDLQLATRGTAAATGRVTGTLNIGGGAGTGVFTVNEGGSFRLAFNAGNGSGADGRATGTVNILTGGTLRTYADITDGGSTGTGESVSIINLLGGTLDLTGRAIGSATVSVDQTNFTRGTVMNVGQINGGNTALTMTGTTGDVLVLDGLNTYTGGTTVAAGGRLVVGSGGAVGNLGAGTVTLGASSVLAFNRSGLLEVNNNIVGSFGAVAQTGTGRTILSGTNTYRGTTTISNGILQATSAAAINLSSTLIVESGAAFYWMTGSGGTLTLSQTQDNLDLRNGSIIGMELGGTISTGARNAITEAGMVTLRLFGNSSLVNPTGSFTLLQAAAGLNTTDYQLLLYGVTNFSATLNPKTATAISAQVTSLVELNDVYWVGGRVASHGSEWAVSTGSTSNWASDVGGTVTPLVPGAGAHVHLSATGGNASSMTLGADLSVGRITISDATTVSLNDLAYVLTLNNTPALTVGAGSGQVDFNTNLRLAAASPVIDLAGTRRTVLSGVLSGNAFSLTGTGILRLSGLVSNTYTGTLSVNGGTLELAKTAGLNAVTGNLVIGDGVGAAGSAKVILMAANQIVNSAHLTFGSDGLLDLAGFSENVDIISGAAGSVITSTGAGNAVLTLGVDDGSSGVFAGSIMDGGAGQTMSIIKNGAGVLTLSGAGSTFSGGLSVLGGSVILGANSAAGSGSVLVSGAGVVLNSGTFTSNITTLRLAQDASITGTGTLSASTSFDVESGSISAKLAGAGALNKTTTGTVTLTGVNSYTGGTNVLAGTLALGTGGTLPTGTNVVLGLGTAAAVLDLGTSSQTIGTLNVNTTTDANVNQILVATGQTLTVNGNIQIGPTASASQFSGTSARLNMTGGGSLVVNNDGGTIRLAVASGTGIATRATLDLSGLSSFTANLGTTGSITIGQGDNVALNSTLLLATNNTITAGSINVGTGSSGGVQTLRFGSGTNIIKTTTFNVGTGGRDLGLVGFSGVDGSVTIAGIADGARTNLNVGTGTASTGATGVQTIFDLSGHESHLLLGTVVVGTQPRAAVATTVFSFDSGTMNMNTLTLGVRGFNSSGNGPTAERTTNATMDIGGGQTVINQGILALGMITEPGASATGGDNGKLRTVNALLNIYGNAVVEIGAAANGTAISMAGSVVAQGAGSSSQANATVSIKDAASVTVRGNIVKEGGSGGATATLELLSGSLDMTGHSIRVDNFTLASGKLSSLSELLDGAGVAKELVKTTTGLLILEGTNTYTGQTRVVDGTLQIGTNLATGTLGAGNVSLESVTSFLSINRNNQYIITQNITGSGGLRQTGDGRTVLRGANTYSGGTLVSNGILEVNAVGALGTGGLRVQDGGAFVFATGAATEITAIQTANLNQALTLEDGSAIGLELGRTLNAGAAATVDGVVELRLFQNEGQYFSSGLLSGGSVTYNLLQASSGLNGADEYRLMLYNVTTYGVELNTPTATGVSATFTEIDPGDLPPVFYWYGGGVAGQENVWAVSNGVTSNWGLTPLDGSQLQALVPGAQADVVVSGDLGSVVFPLPTSLEMSLGAAMNVGSLRFTNAYTGGSRPMTLRDANYGLTISGKDDDGVTLVAASDAGKVTLDLPRLTLLADGDGAPVVEVESATGQIEVIAALTGDALIKRGAGILTLSGATNNSYTGTLTVNAGVLELKKTAGVTAITGNLNINAGTVRLLAADQIVDSATVNVVTGANFVLNGFNETIGGLTGAGNVNSGAAGTATLTVGAGNISSAFDGVIANGGSAPNVLALTKTGTGTFRMNRVNTYSGLTSVLGGTLQYGINDAIAGGAVTVSGGTLDMNGFNDTVGAITLANGGRIIGSGSILSSASTRTLQDGEILVNLAGAGGINKTTNGTVILSGDSTFTGATTLSGGILRLTHNRALGAVSGITTINGGDTDNRLELTNNIVVSEAITIGARSGTINSNSAALSSVGNNTQAGNITFTTGGSYYNIESQSGVFTISGNMAGSSATTGNTRYIQLMGAGDGIVNGSISDGPGAARNFHLIKKGTGTWTLAGANTYTGFTEVQAGTLKVTHSGALAGTSILTVKNGANFAYLSGIQDNDLQIADLTLEGNNRIGVELGNQINITGAASVTGSIVVDVYGISGATYLTGQHTVITAGAGLNSGIYTLGSFYNLTNFTVDSVGKNDQSVWLNITGVTTPTGPFYWKGGFTGGGNVWAITNGLTTGGKSNWATDLAGTDTPLVPGSTADVIFSVTSPTNQDDPMVLGTSMGIGTLTFNTAGEVWLDDQGNSLSLFGANAITVNSGAGRIRLNTNLIFNHAAAVVHVAAGEELGLGAVKGTNGFSKTGTGTLRFIGGTSSTATGTFHIREGLTLLDKGEGVVAISGNLEVGVGGGTTATVRLLASDQIGNTTNVLLNTGSTLDLNGYSEQMGILTGGGLVTTNGLEETVLSLGGGNGSGNFTGQFQFNSAVVGLTKLGTGSQELSSFNGGGSLVVDNGELRLTNGGSFSNLSVGVGLGVEGTPVKFVVEGGTLSVGNGVDSVFHVGRGGPSQSGASAAGWGEVDLTAATQFTANVGQMLIGVESTSATAQSVGVLKLAVNNDITAATEIIIGRSPNSGNHVNATNGPITSRVTFGSGVSTVRTPTMTIGGLKSQAVVDVAAGGIVNIEGLNGGTANLIVGRNDGGTASAPVSAADFSAGTLVARLGSLIIGDKTGGTTGTASGTLILGTSAANNVTVGNVVIGNFTGATTGAGETSGALKIAGGTFNVNTGISMGTLSGSFGTVAALLEITGGEVTVAGNITTNTDSVRSASTVDLNGGRLNMADGFINVDNFLAQSGTLSRVSQLWKGVPAANFTNVANIADLTKISAGVLRLEDANGYTGGTKVNGGTFLVNGTHGGAGSYDVASGATLGGRGTITLAANKAMTIKTGGKLSVGDLSTEAATLKINLSGTGALVFETGSTLSLDLVSGGGHGTNYAGRSDVLDVSGQMNIGTGVTLQVQVDPAALNTWAWTVGDTWQLIDWSSVGRTGTFSTYVLPNIASLGTGLDWDVSQLHVNGTIAIYSVPEPGRMLLVLGGLAALALRRRRSFGQVMEI